MTRKNWWWKKAGKGKRDAVSAEKSRSGAGEGRRRLEQRLVLEELEPRLAPAVNPAYLVDPCDAFSMPPALVAEAGGSGDSPTLGALAATGLDTSVLMSGPGADA